MQGTNVRNNLTKLTENSVQDTNVTNNQTEGTNLANNLTELKGKSARDTNVTNNLTALTENSA